MPYWNQNRYVNVSSIHRDGKYIKFLIALQAQTPQQTEPAFTREVVADCESKMRVELLGAEAFSPDQLKSYFPGTIIGSETQFACDEVARRNPT
jgi:predicted unusual protein kinase regulating ubiquinone biosynthesis (AarF/ABC1/UbiB family)